MRSFHKLSFKHFSKIDPYVVLNLDNKATFKEIKQSYRKLARIYHPDLNTNDPKAKEKFMQIKEAYEEFEKKFNSAKFEANMRFDKEEEPFVSVRETKKKKTDFEEETIDFNILDEKKEERTKTKVESINSFLFTDLPAPRSDMMQDRLKLQFITAPKPKILGPSEYFGFFVLTLGVFAFFYSRKGKYSSQAIESGNYVNIHNALKPSEIQQVYEDNEVSPMEVTLKQDPAYKQYLEKERLKRAVVATSGQSLIAKEEVVPVSLRKQFEEETR